MAAAQLINTLTLRNSLLALRSGVTVASEVKLTRGYCWLKTFPNSPQGDLKYGRLSNFWRLKCEPHWMRSKRNRKCATNKRSGFCISWYETPNNIHLFQKTLSERTANGSCRTGIAWPKGMVVFIFGMQKQWVLGVAQNWYCRTNGQLTAA